MRPPPPAFSSILLPSLNVISYCPPVQSQVVSPKRMLYGPTRGLPRCLTVPDMVLGYPENNGFRWQRSSSPHARMIKIGLTSLANIYFSSLYDDWSIFD